MYKENLSNIQGLSCPPAHAIAPQNLTGFRLVFSVPPVDAHFVSHQMLGKTKPPDLDECKWRSCSLFKEQSKLLNAKGLPKFRGKWAGIAKITLTPDSGRVVTNAITGHIDWWRYANFDAATASIVTLEFK